MAYIGPIASVVAFQSDPTKLLTHSSVSGNVNVGGSVVAFLGGSTNTSVIVVGAAAGNSSVQVVGLMPPQSVSGVGMFNINPIGGGSIIGTLINSSVATLQGTNPWIVQLTSGSVITTGGNSSVQVVGLMPPQSVSGVGTFNIDPQGAGSIIAKLINSSVTAYQGVTPWVANGSVAVMSAVPSSVATLQGTNPWIVNGSVLMIPGIGVLGSVATLQGTSPWLITGSVAAMPLTGASVIAVLQAASIAGTYAEDAGHTSADRGIFTLGVRNDAIASFTSANLDYGPVATDSAGRTVIKPFSPDESYVTGVSSTVNTNPSSLLAVAGTGLRNYVTDLWIANTGSVATLVSFRDGDASLIGKTIAPAGGGSNIRINIPMRTGNLNSPIEFTAGTATSILHVTAFGYKAP